MHLDFGESNLMLVSVDVASTQEPIGLEGLLVQHLPLLELLNLFVYLPDLWIIVRGSDPLLA